MDVDPTFRLDCLSDLAAGPSSNMARKGSARSSTMPISCSLWQRRATTSTQAGRGCQEQSHVGGLAAAAAPQPRACLGLTWALRPRRVWDNTCESVWPPSAEYVPEMQHGSQPHVAAGPGMLLSEVDAVAATRRVAWCQTARRGAMGASLLLSSPRACMERGAQGGQRRCPGYLLARISGWRPNLARFGECR